MRRIWVFAVAACVLWSSAASAAEPKTLQLGQMEVAYDAERWQAEPLGEASATMHPIGPIARKLDSIVITRVPVDGIEGCRTLATDRFSGGHYEAPTARPIDVAGIPAFGSARTPAAAMRRPWVSSSAYHSAIPATC